MSPAAAPSSAARSSQRPPDVCVFLLQLGGPINVAGIEPFLRNLFEDVLPLPGFVRRRLAGLIARRRTPKVRPLYEAMGGGSPLMCNTEAQAGALTAALASRNLKAHVYTCMRYAPPRAQAALEAARRSAPEAPWILLPLYPHYSFSTSRSSFRELEQLMTANERAAVKIVEAYPDMPGYLDAQCACIHQTLDALSPSRRQAAHIVFSAHGLPMSFIHAGDPYAHHIEATVRH